ncbi:membrane-anchored lipid-binding protein LAM4 isoform X7 [Cephus cinctus]|uniref:Membrane-anchored lipid-binding protein LAM4 isoform X7 n=1 Tax=Cephus cinctus TaxID=211228 RepID=A0AAJ7W5K6_CEPCN|nr:membrane-anchored lipid-binding protein LAM4 isoform X7 [Cephus cinctus]
MLDTFNYDNNQLTKNVVSEQQRTLNTGSTVDPREVIESDVIHGTNGSSNLTKSEPSLSKKSIGEKSVVVMMEWLRLDGVGAGGAYPEDALRRLSLPVGLSRILRKTRASWSAGSIGARSAPSTPLQGVVTSHGGQPQSIGEGQLAVAGSNNSQLPPPRSPSHTTLRCSDSHLAKPLSRSTPSMTGGTTQTPATVSRSSPTSTSSARQKKFHRHFAQSSKFCDQVAADERVLNYYSCALVGDILLQGHLYITPNYFAFYSNVFGYVTKLLIPTVSVQKISKEKTARIIPNAVAVTTDDERHVFCSLLSRDSTFKLMKQVWDAAIEARPVADILPLPVEGKLLAPVTLLVDDSEVNPEEDDSSMSESGTDLTSRPPTVCTDTDGHSASIPRPILPVTRCRIDQANLAKSVSSTRSNSLSTTFWGGLRSSTVIAILVAILAALYVSAALMMVRIDRLHTAYLNHPLASPERFTQDQLLQYLNSNLDQIVRVRQSLQTLSQQFVTMTSDSETGPVVSGGTVEPEDASS